MGPKNSKKSLGNTLMAPKPNRISNQSGQVFKTTQLSRINGPFFVL